MALPGRLRRLAGRVTAPVLSQAVTAGTSLLLQVIAARSLGLPGYGAFALCLAVLVSMTALFSAYVGDSIAVLDRRDPRVRAAVLTSMLFGFLLAMVVGLLLPPLLGRGDGLTAPVFAAMLVAWLAEETLRRLFMARLEFWKLLGNDVTYLVVTVLALLALYLATGTVTLTLLFAAMGLGALVAVLAAVCALPGAELRGLRPGWAGMGRVASFAAWRSAQGTLRPAALLGSRALVGGASGLGAVGLLEAGRLVVAPLQVVINGAGSFLLSSFADRRRRGGGAVGEASRNAAVALGGVTLLIGGLLAVFAGPLGALLTGAPVSPLLVLGWAVYLAVWALGLPYVTEVVTYQLSRAVFLVRLVDSVLGLALVGGALLAGAGVTAVPWLMAVGGLYSAWRLRALAIRTRARPAPDTGANEHPAPRPGES